MSKGTQITLKDGGIYTITEEQLQYWVYLYPDLDVIGEISYLKEMWSADAIPRKTAKNVNKFICKWLSKQSKEDL